MHFQVDFRQFSSVLIEVTIKSNLSTIKDWKHLHARKNTWFFGKKKSYIKRNIHSGCSKPSWTLIRYTMVKVSYKSNLITFSLVILETVVDTPCFSPYCIYWNVFFTWACS